MITDKPEFLKVTEILAKSEVSEENCMYITNLIINTVKDRQNLIKYLEDKIEEMKFKNDFFRWSAYLDILERIESGKYE